MKRLARAVAIVMLTFAAIVWAKLLTPTQFIASDRGNESLDALIPRTFGEWSEDASAGVLPLDPRAGVQLAAVYSETLARTYANQRGERVMLSLAYGKDQRGEGRAHYPEVCYPAQGFAIKSRKHEFAMVGGIAVPADRLVAELGLRTEPITYWVTVGEDVVRPGLEHKKAILSYGLRGQVPDGLLVRISSISSDVNGSYALHDRFASALVEGLSIAQRSRLLGNYVMQIRSET